MNVAHAFAENSCFRLFKFALTQHHVPHGEAPSDSGTLHKHKSLFAYTYFQECGTTNMKDHFLISTFNCTQRRHLDAEQ